MKAQGNKSKLNESQANESHLAVGENGNVHCQTPKEKQQLKLTPQKLKSPSDTTIYAPVMRLQKDNTEMIDKISNFVEAIRLEHEGARGVSTKDVPQPGTSQQPNSQVCRNVESDVNNQKVDQLILSRCEKI